jgi:hypothetical protein
MLASGLIGELPNGMTDGSLSSLLKARLPAVLGSDLKKSPTRNSKAQ